MTNIKKILKDISKIGLNLIDSHKEYDELKKRYINNFKIVEYLFNKPTKKTIVDYNNTIKKVYLDPDAIPFLEFGMSRLLDILYSYGNDLREYLKLIKEYIKLTNNKPIFPKQKYLPIYSQLTKK